MAGTIESRNVSGAENHESPSQGKRRSKTKISVPMTAMIDVTFLLLTYFLLTTVFRQEEGQLPGTLPKTGPGPIDLIVKEIPLHVRAVGDASQSVVYSLGGEHQMLRSPRELFESLRSRSGRADDNSNLLIVIQPDRAVRWRHVVEAINQAAGANLNATIRM
ncbi:MAG: hypothetical protein HN350_01350 [Phycisphaerales bacterium]|jgi:biopolymer transport protein ExbD|nr:hypothetical protein [Phycisphaerales bacterium]